MSRISLNPYASLNWPTVHRYAADLHMHSRESKGTATVKDLIDYQVDVMGRKIIDNDYTDVFVKKPTLSYAEGNAAMLAAADHLHYPHPSLYLTTLKTGQQWKALYDANPSAAGMTVVPSNGEIVGSVGDADTGRLYLHETVLGYWDYLIRKYHTDCPIWGYGESDYAAAVPVGEPDTRAEKRIFWSYTVFVLENEIPTDETGVWTAWVRRPGLRSGWGVTRIRPGM